MENQPPKRLVSSIVDSVVSQVSKAYSYGQYSGAINDLIKNYISPFKNELTQLKAVTQSDGILINEFGNERSAEELMDLQQKINSLSAYLSSKHAEFKSESRKFENHLKRRIALSFSAIHTEVKKGGGKTRFEGATDKNIEMLLKTHMSDETIHVEATYFVSEDLYAVLKAAEKTSIMIAQALRRLNSEKIAQMIDLKSEMLTQ